MSEILPGYLFLGGLYDATDVGWLRSRGITRVLTFANGTDAFSLSEELAVANIRHRVFEVRDEDDQDLAALFPGLVDLVDESSDPVLIHCMMGISRSATIVLAYLMMKHKLPLDEATRVVVSKRNYIFPNDGFIRQLLELDKQLFGVYSFLPDVDGIRKFKRLLQYS